MTNLTKIFKMLWISLSFMLFFCFFGEAFGKESPWVLIWEDHFSENHLNELLWRVEDAFLEKNNELQYYLPEEVILKEGKLLLRSRKNTYKGKTYTSGLVDTKGRWRFQYGKLVIRAKLPKGQGIWPAHWLMNQEGYWPPEIDIMELLGHEPKKVHCTHHFGRWPDNRLKGEAFMGPDFSEEFHEFSIEWEKNKITWFVDGKKVWTATENLPHVPFYLILNTAVGGDWPGNPDETTKFPQFHEIDSVQFYKKKQKGTFFGTFAASKGQIVGQVPGTFNLKSGEVLTFETKPYLGHRFSHWLLNGKERKENPIQIKVKENVFLQSFSIPEESFPSNIALKAKVKASSVENMSYPPKNICDGNLNSRWSSLWKDEEWVSIDLGKAYALYGIRIHWERALGKHFKVSISQNGKNWHLFREVKDNHALINEFVFNSPKPLARYIKVEGKERGTEWGYSIFEIEVFGQ